MTAIDIQMDIQELATQKTRMNDLAIFGKAPAFKQPLCVGRPNIGDRERLRQRIDDILDRRILTNHGPFVKEFERRVSEIAGVKHCIAVCNATVGLEIAIRAAGLRGEVIIPSFTFVATAHALHWLGIRPVFCDVDPVTHTIDPRAVEALITPATTGIIGVHVWGAPCHTDALAAIARRHNLALLYDAAHAFGCANNGHKIGGFGDAEVFSFHATKFINSLEGGAIVTNDDALAEKARLMHNFGFADYDKVVVEGTNGKMNEVSAAMGLTSIEQMDALVAANQRNHTRYAQALRRIPGVKFVQYNPCNQSNYQYVVMELDAAVAGISRDDLVNVLWHENVLARRYFHPGCHRMEPYRTLDPQAGDHLPHTERLASQVMALPTGPTVSPEDIDTVCDLIRIAVAHAPKINQQLHRERKDWSSLAGTET